MSGKDFHTVGTVERTFKYFMIRHYHPDIPFAVGKDKMHMQILSGKFSRQILRVDIPYCSVFKIIDEQSIASRRGPEVALFIECRRNHRFVGEYLPQPVVVVESVHIPVMGIKTLVYTSEPDILTRIGKYRRNLKFGSLQGETFVILVYNFSFCSVV